MATSSLPGTRKAASSRERLGAGLLAALALAIVGTIDFFPGRETSLELLDLAPNGLAA